MPNSARSLRPKKPGFGELRAVRALSVPRPEPKPRPARRPERPDQRLVLEIPARSLEMDIDVDVEEEDEHETPDSILELQMDGMTVKEEAWPKTRAVPPPLPDLLPPPKISQTRNRAIRPPPLPVTSKTAMPAVRASTSNLRTVDPEAAIAAFAGFGEAPRSLLEMPSYALHVSARRRILRRELAVARAKGSADVTLYERAIQSANASAVRAGYAVLAISPGLVAAIVLAGLMIFAHRP